MLTAALRDLHLCYPHKFITGVKTSCMGIWENNPYVTPISVSDSRVTVVHCHYPLINQSNSIPYHSLHGFIDYLNQKLNLNIRPTAFKGDIYLSKEEKLWYSQIYELADINIPFWIIAAGGKYDVTIKWWDSQRYQQIVDHFRGRIQFVQVGEWGHHHPKLDGVIDFRGKTDLRQLIRLVYHSQGVLCPVTALMHMSAAVELPFPEKGSRPCVVIAGGREPAHWEAYPSHQFIHTNGALPCCNQGGCWKNRSFALGDGDRRDRIEHRCNNISNNLPRCMDLISVDEVVWRIESYFKGGALNYLNGIEIHHAQKAIQATRRNPFDRQPLNLHNVRHALTASIATLTASLNNFHGNGIVICGGGNKYFHQAWVCIHMLRYLKCALPIELWYLGAKEMSDEMRWAIEPLGVVCIDAHKVRKLHPARILRGWELKAYSILHSSFKQVLYLDADNVPVRNPEYLFETPQFQACGAVFWPDYGRTSKANPIWRSFGLRIPKSPEFETGQILVDKSRCWKALRLTMWINENSDFFYRYLHGDKDTFHLAFAKLKTSFIQINTPIESLEGVMCQHDFDGHRIFQHRNSHKWTLSGKNHKVPGFLFETECLAYLRALKAIWRKTGEPVESFS
jgi:hypothetical protein